MPLKTGQILNSKEISKLFNVCVQRGIRYSGSLKTNIKHVVLIMALNKTPEDMIRNPYKDRKFNNKILYTGEGRYGDQRMERGNLVLKQQKERKYPIYVFEKKKPGQYAFLGQFNVVSVQKGTQRDARGNKRKVFLFKLGKLDLNSKSK